MHVGTVQCTLKVLHAWNEKLFTLQTPTGLVRSPRTRVAVGPSDGPHSTWGGGGLGQQYRRGWGRGAGLVGWGNSTTGGGEGTRLLADELTWTCPVHPPSVSEMLPLSHQFPDTLTGVLWPFQDHLDCPRGRVGALSLLLQKLMLQALHPWGGGGASTTPEGRGRG